MKNSTSPLHYPVMLTEVLNSLDLKKGEVVVDCTVNRGGHAIEIAKKIGPKGKLIMFDLDRVALQEAKLRLEACPNLPKLHFIHSNFRHLKDELKKIGLEKIDKIFADLGLSSEELEISGRGFSFQKDEPLYMTFNSEINKNTFTAMDLINNLSVSNLEKIFQVYGDEKRSWKIAQAIVDEREKLAEQKKQIQTTGQLVTIIEKLTNYKTNKFRYRTHPATKVFQAIRIAVNDEYESLKQLITDGYQLLQTGGRISILSFHSGEDRIVKQLFKKLSKKSSKQKPTPQEIKTNKRSRSAILRTLIKND